MGTRSHTVASVGRKAAGSLATAPRTAEAAAGKGGRWRPLTPIDALHRGLWARWPRTRARPPVRAGRGPGGEEGLSEPAINPTHHGRRSGPGTGPAPSRGEKIRSGGGDSNNFVARPSHSQHQNKPDLKKKKKNPLTELCSGSGARTALDPPPATTAFFSASDSSPAERAAAGGGSGGGDGGGGGSRGGGGASRPLRRGTGERGGQASPAPKTAPTNRLEGPLQEKSTCPIKT